MSAICVHFFCCCSPSLSLVQLNPSSCYAMEFNRYGLDYADVAGFNWKNIRFVGVYYNCAKGCKSDLDVDSRIFCVKAKNVYQEWGIKEARVSPLPFSYFYCNRTLSLSLLLYFLDTAHTPFAVSLSVLPYSSYFIQTLVCGIFAGSFHLIIIYVRFVVFDVFTFHWFDDNKLDCDVLIPPNRFYTSKKNRMNTLENVCRKKREGNERDVKSGPQICMLLASGSFFPFLLAFSFHIISLGEIQDENTTDTNPTEPNRLPQYWL